MEEQDGAAPRDAGNWAAKVERFTVPPAAAAHGFTIEGKRVAGPQQGFGRLWQRTYAAALGDAVTPEALISDWRADFGSFWPKTGHFYGPITAIQPGDVAPLSAGPMTTGIMVLYADDTSFTFLTPQGHAFNGLITFSGERDDDRGTIAQIRILIRTSDPFFESMWPILRRGESAFWSGTLRNIASAHGVQNVAVTERTECLDRARLWKNWRNIRDNSAMRSAWHSVSGPFRARREKAS